MLSEEDRCKDRHQDYTQLVDGRHPRCVSDFEGAEVAQPRGSRGATRRYREEIGPAGYGRWRLPLPGDRQQPGHHEQDNDGANEGGKIGIDILNADLGKYRRQAALAE